jgi:hypothetical protein
MRRESLKNGLNKKRGMVSKWERIIEISLDNGIYQKYIWRLKLKDKGESIFVSRITFDLKKLLIRNSYENRYCIYKKIDLKKL